MSYFMLVPTSRARCPFEGFDMPKVLVVEDEPGIALGLEDTLRLEGYQVEVTTDGASASRRALAEPFDLILLDVMLPGKPAGSKTLPG
jgi:DNA-binding response OmpR family regulator